MFRHYINILHSFFILKTIKYIVWDFDGTLYQSQKLGDDLYTTFLNIVKSKNKKITKKEFDIATEKFGSWSTATAYFTSTPELKILNLADTKFNKLKYIKANPSLVHTIESTLSNYHHLILTNSTSQEVIDSLKIIGFNLHSSPTGPFEKIYSRDITHHLKPDPKIYKQILKFTKALKIQHLFIGDSYAHDIKPAQSLGFQTLPIWEINKIFKQSA